MTRLSPLMALVAGMSFSFTGCAPVGVIAAQSDEEQCDECSDSGSTDTGEADTDTDSDTDADTDADSDADTSTPVDADGDGYDDAPADCDDSDPAVNPGADEACNGIDDNCDGTIDEGCESDPEPQLKVTITSPGGLEYGSMICHIEYLEDGDGDGSLSDEYWGWEYSWVENWVSQTTLESNPGAIDAVRLNCTVCPDELTLDEEPSSPEAEAMGCTWTAVNGSSSTNGSVATWYFEETFSSSLVSVSGGTSVLVDFR